MPVALFESVGPCCYEFEKAGVFSEDCLSEASSAAASFFKFVMADSNRATGITRGFGTLWIGRRGQALTTVNSAGVNIQDVFSI